MWFAALRIGTAPQRTDKVTVRRQVSEKTLVRLQDSIEPESAIKIRATVAEKNVFGFPQMQLEKVIRRNAKDPELQNYLQMLQKPVTFKDKVLGTLTLVRRLNWYSGKTKWNGKSIDVNLSTENPAELQGALQAAHAL